MYVYLNEFKESLGVLDDIFKVVQSKNLACKTLNFPEKFFRMMEEY